MGITREVHEFYTRVTTIFYVTLYKLVHLLAEVFGTSNVTCLKQTQQKTSVYGYFTSMIASYGGIQIVISELIVIGLIVILVIPLEWRLFHIIHTILFIA